MSRIYFIHAPSAGLIKIGVAIDVQKRFWSLRTASPVALELLAHVPGTREDEQALHRILWHSRQHGEWFRDNEVVRAWVTEALSHPQGFSSKFIERTPRTEMAIREVRRLTALGEKETLVLLGHQPKIITTVNRGKFRDAAKLVAEAYKDLFQVCPPARGNPGA